MNILELDVIGLQTRLKTLPHIEASEILGPKEIALGSTNHSFLRVTSNVIVQIQNFRYVEPYRLRFLRKNFVTFQFTKFGSYCREIDDFIGHVCAASVQITNFPESITYVSQQDQCLAGMAIFAEREYLIDEFGLRVDSIREPHKSIFTSPLGSQSCLQISLPAEAWVALDNVLTCELPQPMRDHYIRAKAMELLCLVTAHINAKRPLNPTAGISALQRQRQQLAAAAAIYRRELQLPPSIPDLAARVGLNRNQLIAGFCEEFGLTPYKYSVKLRMEWARSQIADGNTSLVEIAANSGYTNYAAFSRAYHDYFGVPPSELKRRK